MTAYANVCDIVVPQPQYQGMSIESEEDLFNAFIGEKIPEKPIAEEAAPDDSIQVKKKKDPKKSRSKQSKSPKKGTSINYDCHA